MLSTWSCRCCLVLLAIATPAVTSAQSKTELVDPFRQLEEILPTPNEYRTASGAPGHRYWQQRADYDIDVTLDETTKSITGKERILYTNRSPDTLDYLWLQLDQNVFARDSDANRTATAPASWLRGTDPAGRIADDAPGGKLTFKALDRMVTAHTFDGGFRIASVTDANGAALPISIVKTMIRIDLPQPLAPGGRFELRVDWSYPINDAKRLGGRSGYEVLDDGGVIFEIAQFFPRLAAYTDVNGWQHKQFLGSGEFTLEFGDYRVRITAPNDHVVAATGVLQNPNEVLTATQRSRLDQARGAAEPTFVITPEEALAAAGGSANGTKTWVFEAKNVRDFAFASSRTFIWDAQGHNVDGNPVLAMSFYPEVGRILWERYSTHAIIHTLDVYSRFAFRYPYPVAISVNGPVGGMEYPMICFNGPRPEKDGTYTERTKFALIGVVIHEVGHNYFPMIVNSDERQWTWLDEGLNTFLQSLAEREWEEGYPLRRGEPNDIVEYMLSADQVPVMTNSESLLQFGNNAYAKPATALQILRETILGRELFDHAFKTYSQRWAFKRPQPADFFRTMEDASGVDLDWFWRGWFYSTDHVDIGINKVWAYRMEGGDPEVDKPARRAERDSRPQTAWDAATGDFTSRLERFPSLADFYNSFDELDITERDRERFAKRLEKLEPHERELLGTAAGGLNFYVVDLENVGGLVMPVILELSYADGSIEEYRIPAEIWRYNTRRARKLLLTDKPLASIVLDPHLETADADLSNNFFPSRPIKTRFELYKEREKRNPMQQLEDKQGESDDDEGDRDQ